MAKKRYHHGGFTLVEVSIVVVVIGLVLGGILVGQDLIRQYQLRATISQLDSFKLATTIFKDKYRCTPGDCRNAYDFFGDSCGANNSTRTGCNGDGDHKWTYYIWADNDDGELLKYWQHLSLAGLIEGNYSGRGVDSGAGSPTVNIGVNVPKAPLRDTIGWSAVNCNNTTPYLPPPVINHFCLGSKEISFSHQMTTSGYGLSRLEAHAIDSKIDDGDASKGSVIGPPTGFSLCGNDYLSSGNHTDLVCNLSFVW